ncbi:MAG: hypothetical protein HY810_10315 [Candidatus Omnitrophica bacterium]|nr:hypothetical protein [Candidatus Omnitrophota bacterium]
MKKFLILMLLVVLINLFILVPYSKAQDGGAGKGATINTEYSEEVKVALEAAARTKKQSEQVQPAKKEVVIEKVLNFAEIKEIIKSFAAEQGLEIIHVEFFSNRVELIVVADEEAQAFSAFFSKLNAVADFKQVKKIFTKKENKDAKVGRTYIECFVKDTIAIEK